jgi:hypothetical protein
MVLERLFFLTIMLLITTYVNAQPDKGLPDESVLSFSPSDSSDDENPESREKKRRNFYMCNWHPAPKQNSSSSGEDLVSEETSSITFMFPIVSFQQNTQNKVHGRSRKSKTKLVVEIPPNKEPEDSPLIIEFD